MPNDVVSFPVYYATLDNLTGALVKRMQPPLPRLVDTYVEVVIGSANFGQNISGPLPSLGRVVHPLQIQGLTQALQHQMPLMNQVSQLPTVPHLGQPMN